MKIFDYCLLTIFSLPFLIACTPNSDIPIPAKLIQHEQRINDSYSDIKYEGMDSIALLDDEPGDLDNKPGDIDPYCCEVKFTGEDQPDLNLSLCIKWAEKTSRYTSSLRIIVDRMDENLHVIKNILDREHNRLGYDCDDWNNSWLCVAVVPGYYRTTLQLVSPSGVCSEDVGYQWFGPPTFCPGCQ